MKALWGALWWQRGGIDGDTEYLMYENCLPKLFRTRVECRKWIEERYRYLKPGGREDLRGGPHGWRFPKPVKVSVKEETGL